MRSFGDQNFTPPLRATKHCRHYSYNSEAGKPECARGLLAPGEYTRKCWPIKGEGLRKIETPCSGREEYTSDERAAWDAFCSEAVKRTLQILPLIPGNSNDARNRPEWGKSGEFECPACKVGKVRWVRARINGHVHAACSTPFCFQVME